MKNNYSKELAELVKSAFKDYDYDFNEEKGTFFLPVDMGEENPLEIHGCVIIVNEDSIFFFFELLKSEDLYSHNELAKYVLMLANKISLNVYADYEDNFVYCCEDCYNPSEDSLWECLDNFFELVDTYGKGLKDVFEGKCTAKEAFDCIKEK